MLWWNEWIHNQGQSYSRLWEVLLLPQLSPTGLLFMLTALWQRSAVHFYLLAYPKTKPSLIRSYSIYEVSLPPIPSVLVTADSSPTGTLSYSGWKGTAFPTITPLPSVTTLTPLPSDHCTLTPLLSVTPLSLRWLLNSTRPTFAPIALDCSSVNGCVTEHSAVCAAFARARCLRVIFG